MVAVIQALQMLAALALVAFVVTAAAGVVLAVTQVLIPRLNGRIRRRLGS